MIRYCPKLPLYDQPPKRLSDALAQPFASLSGLYPDKGVSKTLKIIGLEGSAPIVKSVVSRMECTKLFLA